MTWTNFSFILVLILFLVSPLLAQEVKLNEVVSSNSSLLDEDGDSPDWFELHNTSNNNVDLTSWSITDNISEPQKWVFPSMTLSPDEYFFLFASGKDRKEIGIASTYIERGSVFNYFVPNQNLGNEWKGLNYDDSFWSMGPSGFGYGDSDDGTILNNGTRSVFLRKTFEISDLSAVQELILDIDYDDAFVAYINGVEVARANITGSNPSFDATPNTDHEALIYQGQKPDRYSLDGFGAYLNEGENVLAIQAHNISAGSSDMTIIAYLSAFLSQSITGGTQPPNILALKDKLFHTNFKIGNGETLYLFNAQGGLVDSLQVTDLPTDVSRGIGFGSSELLLFDIPTPGAPNPSTGFAGVTTSIVNFSHPGGPTSALYLTLGGNGAGEEIRYTNDGSIPSRNSQLYSSPISITSNTIIRASVFKDNFVPSKTQSKSYLVDVSHNLPIVSLVTDPANFFDPNDGIYVLGQFYNGPYPFFGSNIWEDVEVPVHFSFYEPNGELGIEFDAGTKIFGGWSRANDQRSLSIFARNQYGPGSIDYKIFPELEYEEFQALVLRNSGNDFLSTNFRDVVLTGLLKDSDLERQAFRPAATYINGEYWGFYNIREKINEHFLASKQGVNPDEIDLLEANGDVVQGSALEYFELQSFLESNSLVSQSNFNFVKDQIDVDNFILYQVSQIYFDNQDWPGNNIKYWKTKQGKWRWILYDTDFGFGIWDSNAHSNNTLSFALEANGPDWPNPPSSTLLLRKLIENDGFKNDFVNRFADELNTRFLSSRVNFHIDTLRANISSEMGAHFQRWDSNLSSWSNNVQNMKTFANMRPSTIRQHIRNRFNLPNIHRITIENADTDLGYVELNSLDLPHSSWSGDYFQNVPVRLKGIPYEGFKFSHWTGGSTSTSAEIFVNLTDATTFYPHFIPDESAPEAIVINEINYNSSDDFDAGDWIELYNPNDYQIDLSDWELKDSDDDHSFLFPQGTIIDGNGYLIISRNLSKFKGLYPLVSNIVSEFDFGLSSENDSVRIFDEDSNLHDLVSYASEAPWPAEPNGTGASLELIAPELDNNIAENWSSIHVNGSPGAINMIESSTAEEVLVKELKVFPNPSDLELNVAFELLEAAEVRLMVYSLNGQLVLNYEEGKLGQGKHILQKNSGQLQSGIYLIKFVAGENVSIGKWVKR